MENKESKETTHNRRNHTHETHEAENNQNPAQAKATYNSLLIAMSIILAGAMVGTGIFLSSVYRIKAGGVVGQGQVAGQQQQTGDPTAISDVTDDDLIRGNRGAKVLMVEYSDFDCPFCKNVHTTMQQLLQEYGDDLAWVYRQFPLESLHPFAPAKAELSECIGEQAGDEAFWKFADAYFPKQDAKQGVEYALGIAVDQGLNKTQLQSCLDSGKYKDEIAKQIEEAVKSGGRGTPHTILVSGDNYEVIYGAQPIQNFRDHIDELLDK